MIRALYYHFKDSRILPKYQYSKFEAMLQNFNKIIIIIIDVKFRYGVLFVRYKFADFCDVKLS